MRYDPERVGGLPVSDQASGPRPTSPPPVGHIQNTNDGDLDRLALLAINDIENFWKAYYPRAFGSLFHPVRLLLSVDANDPSSPLVCGGNPDDVTSNAKYCPSNDSINWDRSEQTGLLPVAKKYFGDMAVVEVLAHEYGHAIQHRAELPEINFSLVAEQQADCFAGAYMRWVADGRSTRFTLSTGSGLNYLLAGILASRDDSYTPGELQTPKDQPHGTGLDRVSALQIGFEQGIDQCAGIDVSEIKKRRGDLPPSFFDGVSANSDVPITEDTINSLFDVLGNIFKPAQPPSLRTGSANCGNGNATQLAAYCPNLNIVTIDLPALQQVGAHTDEMTDKRLLQGDNTALSPVISRYVMALERQRGIALDSPESAMRTACLTGFAQREMAHPIDVPAGQGITLGTGDLDEAISGLLTNGVVASDVNGKILPAGFTRVSAFRSGLLANADDCYRWFE